MQNERISRQRFRFRKNGIHDVRIGCCMFGGLSNKKETTTKKSVKPLAKAVAKHIAGGISGSAASANAGGDIDIAVKYEN